MRLKLDSLEADLAPELGGGIAAFRYRGRPIFNKPAPGARDVTALGEFPMGPYVNRIAHGRFDWRGETIVLPRNRADQIHPLHGLGWQRAWTSERLAPHVARMRLTCDASPHWPWECVAMERVVTLTESGMDVAFSLTHDDPRPMPASIGLHPHFASKGARVQFRSDAMWLSSADGIPLLRQRTEEVDVLAAGVTVAELDVDDCFAGWDGRAEISWPDRTLYIETDPPQRFVQLYVPRGADYFCLEPQSAMPDAVNHTSEESGAVELVRGKTLTFTTRFTVG